MVKMYDAAQAAKDAAMEAVDANADPAWKAAADDAIATITGMRQEFTTDPVWVLLDRWEWPRPREPRALGPRMRATAYAGLIENTGRVHQSKRVSRHAAPLTVWRRLGKGGARALV
jgi:hypothetical protein